MLRRVGFAYALFSTAEYGIWIALLVYAYGHGGATAGMVIVLVQLVPCIALGPFLGALADRRRPSRVLFAGYGLQALSMAGVAASIGARAPVEVVFVLAPLTALSLTVTRPPQAAVLPAIVRSADELTAANVMGGWTDGAAALVGPGLAGVLLAWHGPGLAIAATATMSAAAAFLVAGVTGPAAAISSLGDDGDVTEQDDGRAPGLVSGTSRALKSIGSGARSNLMLAVRNSQIRILLTLHAFYFMLIGALDLLCVILALDLLHMGAGGAGFLNSALGGGALVAGFVTAFLVGRRHLANTLTISIAVAVVALGDNRRRPEGGARHRSHRHRGAVRCRLRCHGADAAAAVGPGRRHRRVLFHPRGPHGHGPRTRYRPCPARDRDRRPEGCARCPGCHRPCACRGHVASITQDR